MQKGSRKISDKNDSQRVVDFPFKKQNLDRNILALKCIAPDGLGERYLQKAKHGFICPNPACRDGAGKDGTGMTVYQEPDGTFRYYCGKCQKSYDNIDVLGFYYNLDTKHDFIKIMERAAENFNLPEVVIGEEQFSEPVKLEIPDKHKDLILSAEKNLKSFLEKHGGIWRGLTAATLKAFKVGYLHNWYARKGAPPTPRIIIPTSYDHYFARLDGNIKDFNIPDDVHLDAKEHRGSKEFFNFKRAVLESTDPIIFVVEGEIDAMSIYQATDGKINVIAISGSALAQSLERQLKNLLVKKKFVVMLDADNTGKDKSPMLVTKFQFYGHNAISLTLSDIYKDANDFLQADHVGLKNRLLELYDQAKKAFDNSLSSAPFDVDKIQDWEKFNGTIKPATLEELKKAAIHIANTTDYYNAANNPDIINALGMLRFYSCFSSVDNNFFAQLRAARNIAKAKVNSFNKKINDAQKYKDDTGIEIKKDENSKPTDSEFGLFTLNISKLSSSVDKIATQVGKEHKKWLKQKIANDTNAERKAYEDNPDTTQAKFPDCPIDLIIPVGIFCAETYIKVVDYEKSQRDGGHPSVTALNNLIFPTKIIRDQTNHQTQYNVVIKTGDTWRHSTFSGKILQDPRGVSVLGDFGAHIADNRMTAKYFAKIIALNEQNNRLPQIKCYSQPGWHNGEFIDPRGGEDFVVQRDGIDYKALFATCGDKNAWIEEFKKVMRIGQIIPKDRFYVESVKQCVIGAIALAQLLGNLKLPNFQLLIWGNKNFAKSPILKLGLSLFGDPNEGKLFRNMSATDKNKLTMSAGLNNFAIGYDEAESASKFFDPQKSSYDFFGGVINQANKRDGTVRSAEHFRAIQVMTAENPPIDIGSAKGGVLKRIIQLRLDKPFMTEDEARDLHIFLANNYGHCLSTWIEYIKAQEKYFKEYFDLAIGFIDSDGIVFGKRVFDFRKYEQTNFRAIVGCLVAYHCFLAAIGLAEKVDVQAIADAVTAIMKELPTADELDDCKRALFQLRSYCFDVKYKYFYREEFDNQDISRHEPYEKYGIIFSNGDIGFFTSHFKTICDDLEIPSYTRLLNDVYDRGFLDGASKRYKRKPIRWHGEIKNIYCFKSSAFDFCFEDIDD